MEGAPDAEKRGVGFARLGTRSVDGQEWGVNSHRVPTGGHHSRRRRLKITYRESHARRLDGSYAFFEVEEQQLGDVLLPSRRAVWRPPAGQVYRTPR